MHGGHGAVGTVDHERERLQSARDPRPTSMGERCRRTRAAGRSVSTSSSRQQGDRGRARRVLPGVDLQRPGPGPDDPRDRRRSHPHHARRTRRIIRTRSTSTASIRRGWTGSPGSARSKPARRSSTTSSPSRSARTSITAITPLVQHIHRGLYGAFIVDPKKGRPDANEMVMVMNAFDTNFDGENEVYAINTIAFAYVNDPIQIERRRTSACCTSSTSPSSIRINSIHIHANFFNLYRTGTSLEPDEFTDIISMGQAERHMIEFTYHRHRPLHVPRAPDRVRRPRLDEHVRGEADGDVAPRPGSGVPRGCPLWLSGTVAAPGRPGLHRFDPIGALRESPPVESVAFERTTLEEDTIELSIRNDGPDAVTIAQVLVNDAYWNFEIGDNQLGRLETTTRRIGYPWEEGLPVNIGLVTSTGVVIDHEIEAATLTPEADAARSSSTRCSASTSASSRSRSDCCGSRRSSSGSQVGRVLPCASPSAYSRSS